MTLHCLYRTPDSPTALRLLQQLLPGDVVVLLAESVVLARESNPALAEWVATGARLHALDDDLLAHGVSKPAPEVSSVSYLDWLSLSEQCTTQIAWH
jgi:sulfur relay protein TusB/DsrH